MTAPIGYAIPVAIALAAFAIVLSFIMSNQAGKFGFAVSQRFLERGNCIPPDASPITHEALRAWALDPRNSAALRGYVRRVLPLDILFLAALGCFLGLASGTLAQAAGARAWLATSSYWWFWILPALYMSTDFTEDLTIAWLLTSPLKIDQSSYGLLRALTKIKLFTVAMSFAELVLVLTLCLVRP